MKLIPDDLKTIRLIPDEKTKKFIKEEFNCKDFFKSSDFMKTEYEPTIDFSKDIVFSKIKRLRGFDFTYNYLNMAKPLNIDSTQEPIRTDNYIKKLDMVYSHIKKVLSNGDNDLYEYILNFFACSIAGRKLRKALYFQSEERTGKGIIFNNLINGILGERMHKTNSVESIIKYTKPFEGITLLNLDELPYCENFKGVQDALKGLITEPTFTCRDMFTSGYNQVNSFNVIITTNNNAVSLTQNNKERYIICEIDESKKGDLEYFKKLASIVNDDNIKLLFFKDMMKRYETLNDWNEDIAPFTKLKKSKIIEALPNFYKYIKDEYILTNTDINVKTDDFLLTYQLNTKDKTSKQQLGKYLTKIGIIPIKLSNNAGYKYSKTSQELLEVFNKNNWIDEDVDLINPSQYNNNNNSNFDDNPKDDIIKKQQEEIEQLKAELEKLKSKPKKHKHKKIELTEDELLEKELENLSK